MEKPTVEDHVPALGSTNGPTSVPMAKPTVEDDVPVIESTAPSSGDTLQLGLGTDGPNMMTIISDIPTEVPLVKPPSEDVPGLEFNSPSNGANQIVGRSGQLFVLIVFILWLSQ